jgi:hypothetical protein
MVARAWTPGHATRARTSMDSDGARTGRRSGAIRRRAADESEVASPATRARRAFFWPIVTQQVARVAGAFSLRDVSAAIAAAGAFALWALALSLLVV